MIQFNAFCFRKKNAYHIIISKQLPNVQVYSITQVTQNNIMGCMMILASMCVLYKFYLDNKIEIVCMVVLVVGSESSQNWVRVVSGLGPIRLGSEKYQGSELSWVRVVRLPSYKLTCEPSAQVS